MFRVLVFNSSTGHSCVQSWIIVIFNVSLKHELHKLWLRLVQLNLELNAYVASFELFHFDLIEFGKQISYEYESFGLLFDISNSLKDLILTLCVLFDFLLNLACLHDVADDMFLENFFLIRELLESLGNPVEMPIEPAWNEFKCTCIIFWADGDFIHRVQVF